MKQCVFLLLLFILFTLSGCVLQSPKPEQLSQKKETPSIQPKKMPTPAPTIYEKNFENCFQTGHTTATASCYTKIEKFINGSFADKKKTVLLEVHTDKSGKASTNLYISKKRAQKLVRALDKKEINFYYAGLGEEEPLVDALTKSANQKNRRVYVKVIQGEVQADTSRYTHVYTSPSLTTKHKQPIAKKQITPKMGVQHSTSKQEKIYKNIKENRLAFKSASSASHQTNMSALLGEALDAHYKEKLHQICVDDSVVILERKSGKQGEGVSYEGVLDSYDIRIYPLYISKDGVLLEKNPKVRIYKNGLKKDSFSTTLNAYKTQKGVLYRLFVNSNNAIRCIDLVVPKRGEAHGVLYFVEKQRLKEIHFTPFSD